MRTTRGIALGALTALLLAACGDDDTSIPQAAPSNGGGGCTEQQQTDAAAWQPARYTQDDYWQPPTEPAGVGESIPVGDWSIAVTVIDIETNAAGEMDAALAELGGTPPPEHAWIVARATITNSGAEVAYPYRELESRYVDRHGDIHVDYSPCEKSEGIGIAPAETTEALSLVPVPPDLLDGGYWGIAAVADPGIDDLTFVR